jgi:hypothetical protein
MSEGEGMEDRTSQPVFLSEMREIVMEHGAFLVFESEPGRGTTVRVRSPLEAFPGAEGREVCIGGVAGEERR